MEKDIILNLSEAAERVRLTRQALCLALKKGRLKGFTKACRWYVHAKDLDHYQAFKYCRDESKDEDGNLIRDNAKGLYSVSQAAKKLNIPVRTIYYWIQSKRIPIKRVGWTYLVHIDDLLEVYSDYEDRKKESM